jgi:hypothetical protein
MMRHVPRPGLAVPAVAGRGLNELLGVTASREYWLLGAVLIGCSRLPGQESLSRWPNNLMQGKRVSLVVPASLPNMRRVLVLSHRYEVAVEVLDEVR